MATSTPDAADTLRVPSTAETHDDWITDGAWLSGYAGAVAVLVCASFYSATNALKQGLFVAGIPITNDRTHSILIALFGIALCMIIVEVVRLWDRDKAEFISINPALRSGNYGSFLGAVVGNWLLNLSLLWLVREFYHTATEYAYAQGRPYYQPWFICLELFWKAYLWGGLPYVALTRALKHDIRADRRDSSTLFLKVLQFVGSSFSALKKYKPTFDAYDKKTARAFLVKLFFTPLMTVFFCDQFPHLVSNVGYMLNGLADAVAANTYSHQTFNNDFFNISISTIFSIDVALAWTGYVISSRWVDNQTVSAEPTMLGWAVTLICYPPFQMLLGLYYAAPGEREVMQFTSQWMITIFTGMMALSYLVYMSATLYFGVRFSNLTHRGIIRKGPYAYVRHPAYAAKNFAWWCVMFPAIIWNATHTGLRMAIIQIIGLVLMTWIYYLRAITEERHLSVDPVYQEYCKQVPYRFIHRVV